MPTHKSAAERGLTVRTKKYYKFDLRAYITKLGIMQVEVASTLRVPKSQLQNWIAQKAVPVPVLREAFRRWGSEGFTTGPMHDNPRLYLLPSYYSNSEYAWEVDADGMHVPHPDPTPEPVPATPEPEPSIPDPRLAEPHIEVMPVHHDGTSIPLPLFESIVGVLVRQSAAILAEKAIIERENLELHKTIELLRTDTRFDSTLKALDKVHHVPVEENHVEQITKQLEKINLPTAAPVISDLRKRIEGFRKGLH